MGSKTVVTLKMNDSVSSSKSSEHEQESIQYSSFDDASCGEPLSAQHVVLDFTPVEEDSDYVQKKCCAFWDFISTQPQLQRFIVKPEKKVMYRNVKTNTSSEIAVVEQSTPSDLKRTAVSMLEIVEEKGLINRIFETKLPQSQCTLGSREYRENEINLPPTKASSSKQNTVCTCTGNCKMCAQRQGYRGSSVTSTPAVVDLCSKMQVWDDDHPKVMDPPGHPPLLSHCTMQRNKPS